MRFSTPFVLSLSTTVLLSVSAELVPKRAPHSKRLTGNSLGKLLGGVEDSTGLTYLEASLHLIDNGDTKDVPKGVLQDLGKVLKKPVGAITDKLDDVPVVGDLLNKVEDGVGLDTVTHGLGLDRRDDPLSLGEIEDKSGLTYLETAAHLVNGGDVSKVKPGLIQEIGSKLAVPVNVVASSLNDLSAGEIEKIADKVGLTDVLMGAGLRRSHRSAPRRLSDE